MTHLGPRDERRARKFAVTWSTRPSQEGEIANLSGCYLRAVDDANKLRRALRDLVVEIQSRSGVWEPLMQTNEYKARRRGAEGGAV